MADRRRINGPAVATHQPIFLSTFDETQRAPRPRRTRKPDQPRKIFLQNGLIPSASGSAYYELEPSSPPNASSLQKPSSLKLSCTVHGPKPLPRNTAFSPQLLLTTSVKYAPFASRQRRGFIKDGAERDLGAHLETALKGVILGDRWPKSSADVTITILEDDEDVDGDSEGWSGMNVLAGCITAASAALVEAGIDCLDLVSGGTAALVEGASTKGGEIVADPGFAEHKRVQAACCVGYLASRDELVELWMRGEGNETDQEKLLDRAVAAAMSSRTVLAEVLRESTAAKMIQRKKAQAQEVVAGKG